MKKCSPKWNPPPRQKQLPSLSEVRAQLREIEEKRAAKQRALAINNYEAYLEYTHHGLWKPSSHLSLLCTTLEAVERGDIVRLIIDLPPRHGKSMSVTESFPSWCIGKRPDRRVISVSYGDTLSQQFGRRNREKLERHGEELFNIRLSPAKSSVTDWEIFGHRGGMLSVGIGGGFTGRGGDLIIIDDPIKNKQESESETKRRFVWKEWQSSILTRLQAGGAVIIIMTRWHEDDLVGRIIKDDTSGKWSVINLPCLSEGDGDLLGRAEGEPLWADGGYDAVWADEKKLEVGERAWEALYQGKPTPGTGVLFKREHFRRCKAHETVFELITSAGPQFIERKNCKIFQTCDVAGSTKSSADYFVVGTFGLTPNNDLLVLDIFRSRMEGPDHADYMKRSFHQFKPVLVGVESKNMGLTLYQQLVRDGLPILELCPDTDKYTRAIPAAARYGTGSIYHLDGAAWQKDFEDELIAFPFGAHDDQVDVLSHSVFMVVWGFLAQSEKRNDKATVYG